MIQKCHKHEILQFDVSGKGGMKTKEEEDEHTKWEWIKNIETYEIDVLFPPFQTFLKKIQLKKLILFLLMLRVMNWRFWKDLILKNGNLRTYW